ncbi:MAG: hypothetical protein H8E68_08955 [Kiritimatiellaeota bacterium]|nr:hypothetical protein [Kiritimatiellota bacterium]
MKFLVITPVFNGMPHIKKCIGSVRGQLRPSVAQMSDVKCQRSDVLISDIRSSAVAEAMADKTISETGSKIDVQHIIQDGGSTDGTVEFLRDYMAQQPATSNYQPSFISEADKGMYDAINKGWAKAIEMNDAERSTEGMAHSTFNVQHLISHPPNQPNNQSAYQPDAEDCILSWLNHDEQYLPGTLEKVAQVFAGHPEVDLVYGNYIISTPDGLPISARREIPLRMLYLRHTNLYAASCTMFFRRKIWEAGELKFDINYKVAGDMELVMRLLSKGYKPLHIDSYLALFGADGGNLSVSMGDLNWKEISRLWSIYHGFGNPLVRKGIKALRWIERFFSGCYRSDDLAFDYAEDEVPNYRRVEADKVTFRFGFDKINELVRKRCQD